MTFSNLLVLLAELGMQQHCRDNVNIFSTKTLGTVDCIMATFVWLPHLDTESLTFSVFLLVNKFYRYVVAKLTNCRVPSPGCL